MFVKVQDCLSFAGLEIGVEPLHLEEASPSHQTLALACALQRGLIDYPAQSSALQVVGASSAEGHYGR